MLQKEIDSHLKLCCRKISFSDVCRFMIELQSKSLPNEVMDYFGHTMDAPTVSAFIQQRQKIMKEGFEYLFHSFVSNCQPRQDHLYHGYRLLACDGSDVNISINPSDESIETTLTWRHTKETLEHPGIYTILPQYTDFDYLDKTNPYYFITFRIVRFRTENGRYTCVATNLPEDEFPLEEIKRIYKMRWGVRRQVSVS